MPEKWSMPTPPKLAPACFLAYTRAFCLCSYPCMYKVRKETHLSSVGQEQGRGEVSCDTTQDVNDRDADPTSQLLKVSQYRHLKHHWHHTVEQSTHKYIRVNYVKYAALKCWDNWTNHTWHFKSRPLGFPMCTVLTTSISSHVIE